MLQVGSFAQGIISAHRTFDQECQQRSGKCIAYLFVEVHLVFCEVKLNAERVAALDLSTVISLHSTIKRTWTVKSDTVGLAAYATAASKSRPHAIKLRIAGVVSVAAGGSSFLNRKPQTTLWLLP